ncbi:glycine cleavage system H protein [Neorhizobium galegae]|uniref:glycine cleavage system protein GcvH n=1 Tax=Neorhizobium galegae TaxID=399 RepID=UPI001AE3411E|nr:glycine cleavage system protein GcvH [Neorhizobium galegae]MBP2562534.1 glycine cleavage system H protein [Neorhizobium galegae]
MSKLYFTQDHEWIRVDGEIATVGITEYAQDQLGDMVFVGAPDIGSAMSAGDVAVVVESVKAASDVYSPIDGEIVEVNEQLSSAPDLLNRSPETDGWLWKMKIANTAQLEGLMDAVGYKSHIA